MLSRRSQSQILALSGETVPRRAPDSLVEAHQHLPRRPIHAG